MNFIKYVFFGVFNTIIHIIVFLIFYYMYEVRQALSNLIAFLVSVNFSYFMNLKYNFSAKYSLKKNISFIFLMGLVSYGVGCISDQSQINPYITMIFFSFISLVFGFALSKYFIFKG